MIFEIKLEKVLLFKITYFINAESKFCYHSLLTGPQWHSGKQV